MNCQYCDRSFKNQPNLDKHHIMSKHCRYRQAKLQCPTILKGRSGEGYIFFKRFHKGINMFDDEPRNMKHWVSHGSNGPLDRLPPTNPPVRSVFSELGLALNFNITTY